MNGTRTCVRSTPVWARLTASVASSSRAVAVFTAASAAFTAARVAATVERAASSCGMEKTPLVLLISCSVFSAASREDQGGGEEEEQQFLHQKPHPCGRNGDEIKREPGTRLPGSFSQSSRVPPSLSAEFWQ